MTGVTSPGGFAVAYRYDNTGAGGGEAPAAYPGQRTKITYPDSKPPFIPTRRTAG